MWEVDTGSVRYKAGNDCRGQITGVRVNHDKESFTT